MGNSAKFRIPDSIGASVIPDGVSARREWNQKALTEKQTSVLLADKRQLEQVLRHQRAEYEAHVSKKDTAKAVGLSRLIAHNEARLIETQRRLGR